MTSITRQRIGKRTYLYESISFRNANGKPRNKKTPIGKMDPITGQVLYKQDYLDRMAAAGSPVPIADTSTYRTQDPYAQTIALMDSIKDYGAVYLLGKISEKIGLTKILSAAIPEYWQEVLTLACYMILSDKPVMYCSDWVACTETLSVGDLSSQRISELLVAFGAKTRHAFFEAWARHVSDQEYIALDITSISAYSELVTENEWGYNRDQENLAQINLCMLLGEQSRLPIYQTVYSGSLKDVSTLQCTLAELTALVPEKNVRIVMDKGFFSVKNIDVLLSAEKKQGFLISLPFTSNFACKQVESERKDIDQIGNTIITSGSPIRGVHQLRAWGTGELKLHTHILYNPEKALKDRNDLYGYVTDLIKKAEADPHLSQLKEDFHKYLMIRKSEKQESGYTISIREDVIQKQLRHAGWLVLISNTVSSTQEAHDLYRIKDVVEKGFCKFKNSLGLSRLHIQSNDRMQNKIFVGFIALILMSWIHKNMSDQGMYKQMTFDKMMLTLSKIKIATINDQKILRPLTKDQKQILQQLGVDAPVG